jgi:hypothetical protein
MSQKILLIAVALALIISCIALGVALSRQSVPSSTTVYQYQCTNRFQPGC